jgi:hypothetical protein
MSEPRAVARRDTKSPVAYIAPPLGFVDQGDMIRLTPFARLSFILAQFKCGQGARALLFSQ